MRQLCQSHDIRLGHDEAEVALRALVTDLQSAGFTLGSATANMTHGDVDNRQLNLLET